MCGKGTPPTLPSSFRRNTSSPEGLPALLWLLAQESPQPPQNTLWSHIWFLQGLDGPLQSERGGYLTWLLMCTGDFQGRTGWWLQSKNSRVRMHSPQSQVIGSFIQTGSTWESPSSRLLYEKAAFSFNIKSDQPNKGCQSYITQNMYNCKHNITTSRKIKHTFQYDTKTCISTSLRDQHRWNSMIKVTSWQYHSWTEILQHDEPNRHVLVFILWTKT